MWARLAELEGVGRARGQVEEALVVVRVSDLPAEQVKTTIYAVAQTFTPTTTDLPAVSCCGRERDTGTERQSAGKSA